MVCPCSESSLLKSSHTNTHWSPCRSVAFWIKTVMNPWWCWFITVPTHVAFLASPLQICAGWQLASWAWLWPSSSLDGLSACWGAVGIEALCSMWQGFSSSWEVRMMLFEEKHFFLLFSCSLFPHVLPFLSHWKYVFRVFYLIWIWFHYELITKS